MQTFTYPKAFVLFFFMATSTGSLIAQPPKSEKLTLKQAATGLFKIGVGVNADLLNQPEPLAFMKREFDFVTPENCLKIGSVQRKKEKFRFQKPDRFVDVARKNGLQVVGHCLVWAKDNRTPEWMFKDGAGQASSKTLMDRMRDHMTVVQERYRDKIHHWDVVNEALADQSKVYRESTWKEICGLEFLVDAFKKARKLDPDGLLIYNDYRCELPGKRESLFKFIEFLQDNDAPVDAIGLQGHYELDKVPYDDLDFTINKIREYGLKVVMSEVDIDVVKRSRWWADGGKYRDELKSFDPYKNGCPPEILKRQAEQYAKLFKIYAKHSDIIERVTFWNLHDGESWLNHFPWERVNYPLLIDRTLKPKPAYDAVVEVLKNARRK